MSNILSISVTEEKKSIVFYDCTGSYRYDNLNGYGTPNFKVENAVEAYLEIKNPTWKEGQEPIKIDLFPDFPTVDKFGFELTPSKLGGTNNEVESGQYKIKYVVVMEDSKGSRFTFTAYVTLFCIKSVTCCIDKRVKEIRANGFNDPKQQLIIELSTLLESVNYQVECENYETANEMVEYLKTHCKCCGCS